MIRRATILVALVIAWLLLAGGAPTSSNRPARRPFMVGMLDWRLDAEERAKRIENRSFTLWLMTSDTTLAPGDSLTLLWNAEDADTTYAQDAPLLQRGRVVGRAKVGPTGPGNMYNEDGDVFYHVSAPQPRDLPGGLGFAVRAGPEEFLRVGDRVEVDLDQDGVAERFFTCASYEGVHLTVWSGVPMKGEERWHRYYYVPYDTEPTCFSADSSGVGEED